MDARQVRTTGGWRDFSAQGWGRVALVTALGTIFCLVVTLLIDSRGWAHYSPEARASSLQNDILLPIILAVPLLGFTMSKLRELAIAHHKLQIVAATDSLTDCLNRGAFTALVDAYLSKVAAVGTPPAPRGGALLVIDADHFKGINDRFGHDRGDEALRLIAAGLRDGLRDVDLVGRMGGEEFAVFLPGCDDLAGQAVAERIRRAVNAIQFAPGSTATPLSVSIGGASFTGTISFSELYRQADSRLYAAKRQGRNRVHFSPAPLPHAPPAIAATMH